MTTFRIWVNTLHRIFQFAETGELTQHLGAWTANPLDIMKITTLVHTDNENIAVWDYHSDQWKLHQHTETRWGNHHFDRINFVHCNTLDYQSYVPADYWMNDTSIIMNGRDMASIDINDETNVTPIEINRDNTISLYFEQSNLGWSDPLIGAINTTGLQNHQFNNNDTIILCSDGGLKDNIGSYGMVFCVNGEIKAYLKGRVPPTYNKLTSQRCE
jgi:hypothetical protein